MALTKKTLKPAEYFEKKVDGFTVTIWPTHGLPLHVYNSEHITIAATLMAESAEALIAAIRAAVAEWNALKAQESDNG